MIDYMRDPSQNRAFTQKQAHEYNANSYPSCRYNTGLCDLNRTDMEQFSRNLDWNLLFSFMIIVEERGVTRAAKRLLVSQPAATNALKRLELHFDARLVDRSAQGFALTKTGQLVFEECLEIYGSVSRMTEILKNQRNDVTGHVSLATPTHAESPVIDAALSRFYRENPKVTLSIDVITSGDVVTSVKRKNASCGIGLVTSRSPLLDYEVIYREQFALYCGHKSALFGRDDVTREEVCAQPYITFPTDVLGGELHNLTVIRQKYGIESAPVAESYHLEELRRLIEIGVGIGPHPVHVAQRFVDQGRLWRLTAFDDLPVFEVCLITNPRTRPTQAELAFIHIFQEEIRRTSIADRSY